MRMCITEGKLHIEDVVSANKVERFDEVNIQGDLLARLDLSQRQAE